MQYLQSFKSFKFLRLKLYNTFAQVLSGWSLGYNFREENEMLLLLVNVKEEHLILLL